LGFFAIVFSGRLWGSQPSQWEHRPKPGEEAKPDYGWHEVYMDGGYVLVGVTGNIGYRQLGALTAKAFVGRRPLFK
jgi:hypothetical protein